MTSRTLGIISFGALVVGLLLMFRNGGSAAQTAAQDSSNVMVADGQQIVAINVKGGYQPETSIVKAGTPTVVRFHTGSTFDCSSSVRIPSLGISKNLPPTGDTDISLGELPAGTLLGMCGMGMYQFVLEAR